MQPKRLKPTQPVYFNLAYEEDREFWDDIHDRDKIPNFTKWVKTQWNIWKQQNNLQEAKEIIDNQIFQEIQITQISQPEIKLDIPQEKSKGMNASSLTKMFGMKIS